MTIGNLPNAHVMISNSGRKLKKKKNVIEK
jgi:hypothetical protein